MLLTHWGQVTHICVSRITIIGSDNGLPPDQRQAIIWTNAGILLIGPLGTNFSEISIEILIFSFKKMRLKVSSGKRRPFCLGLNVLIIIYRVTAIWLRERVNSLWPSDATWIQVMARYLMAPSHYLNQFWLLPLCNKALWHSTKDNVTGKAQSMILKLFGDCTHRIKI